MVSFYVGAEIDKAGVCCVFVVRYSPEEKAQYRTYFVTCTTGPGVRAKVLYAKEMVDRLNGGVELHSPYRWPPNRPQYGKPKGEVK